MRGGGGAGEENVCIVAHLRCHPPPPQKKFILIRYAHRIFGVIHTSVADQCIGTHSLSTFFLCVCVFAFLDSL